MATMRWMLAASALLLGAPAMAGEVWMSLSSVESDGSKVTLEMPAGWLVDADNDLKVDITEDRGIDLEHEIRAMQNRREGAKKHLSFTEQDGSQIEVDLEHRKKKAGKSQSLAIEIAGGEGMGLSLAVPLDGGSGQLGIFGDQVTGGLNIDGLDIDIDDDAFLALLRDAPPVVLLDATDADGSHVRIQTK